MYFAGDGAKRDDDGDLWLLGRVDDVMLVSGHNISTTEVESALVAHPKVAEAAVVGATDPTTGQAIVAFVILRGGVDEAGEALIQELRDHVAKTLGPIAKPRQIMLVAELPKTRSGKIMRRLLRDVAENRVPRRRHHAAGLDRHGPDLGGHAVRQVRRGLTAPRLEAPGRRRSPPVRDLGPQQWRATPRHNLDALAPRLAGKQRTAPPVVDRRDRASAPTTLLKVAGRLSAQKRQAGATTAQHNPGGAPRGGADRSRTRSATSSEGGDSAARNIDPRKPS